MIATRAMTRGAVRPVPQNENCCRVRLLLDTHLLLWAAAQRARLPRAARAMLDDTGNELIFSAASIWEVAIKRSLGRPGFSVEPALLRRSLLDNAYAELVVTSHHAVAVAGLPAIHQDPFDRILVAQALVEGTLVADRRSPGGAIFRADPAGLTARTTHRPSAYSAARARPDSSAAWSSLTTSPPFRIASSFSFRCNTPTSATGSPSTNSRSARNPSRTWPA